MTPTLYLCVNRRTGAGSCSSAGAHKVMAALHAEIEAHALSWEIRLSPCLGHCGNGPNIKAAPGGPMLHGCTDAKQVMATLLREWRQT